MAAAGNAYPSWGQKTDAILDWVAWATSAKGSWFYTKQSRGTAQPNKPYFELFVRNIIEVGVPEVLQIDLENPPDQDTNGAVPLPTATADDPRAEVVVSQREIQIDLHVHSFDQDTNQTAWVVADTARTRMRMPAPQERFIRGKGLGLIELFQVVNMPTPVETTDDRFFSEAVLEMRLATSVAASDESAVGTFIERTRITSNLIGVDGQPLNSAIQINNELMGVPLA